jgi:hypothetical protein
MESQSNSKVEQKKGAEGKRNIIELGRDGHGGDIKYKER